MKGNDCLFLEVGDATSSENEKIKPKLTPQTPNFLMNGNLAKTNDNKYITGQLFHKKYIRKLEVTSHPSDKKAC